MRILFLSGWFPWPANNGSKLRIYHLLRGLAERHKVTLLSFADQPNVDLDAPALRSLCCEVQVVPWTTYSPRRLRAVLGFLSLAPRSVVDTYSQAMERLVANHLATRPYDLILASQISTAPYVPRACSLPSVFEEVETAVIKDAVASSQGWQARKRAWLTWAKLRHYLARLVQRFDACTVASAQELTTLREIAPAYDGGHIIPNGVDVDYCKPGSWIPSPNTLVYNGALTYSANYDAVIYFLDAILPRVQAELPGVELKVTGSTCGVALEHLPTRNGVTFTGYVDDIRPVVAGSWACVVPLRIGGGTRLKILEAMALGTPVVATSKGAEGLEVTPEVDILIADDPITFAAQTVRLLREPRLRQHLAENGRRLVEQKYSWIVIANQFSSLLESVARGRPSR